MTISHPTVRRLLLFGARTGSIASVTMLALSAWAFWWAAGSPAGASPTAGLAQIVTPIESTGGGVALTGGGSTTAFTLLLPGGAACTGDSANAGYRVQGYMVLATADPGGLSFGSTGPIPRGMGATFRQPLYGAGGSAGGTSYVNQQTAAATVTGGPGPIVNVPAFDFAVFTPGQIAPGTYNVGIACTLGPASATQVDKFWNVQMIVAAAPADAPAGIAWTVAATQLSTTSSTTTSSTTSTTSSTATTSTTSTSTGSSTTVAGVTSTTAPGSTTTVAIETVSLSGDPTVSAASAGDGGTAAASDALARTGGNPGPLLIWSVLSLVLGRMAVLLGRSSQRQEGRAR